MKSKKYVVPVAALHPLVVGGLAIFYLTQTFIEAPAPTVQDPPVQPHEIAARLVEGSDAGDGDASSSPVFAQH